MTPLLNITIGIPKVFQEEQYIPSIQNSRRNYTTALKLQLALTDPKLVLFSSGKTHFQTDTYIAELSSIYPLTCVEHYIRTEKVIFHNSGFLLIIVPVAGH